MTNDLVFEYTHFIQTIRAFPPGWLNSYFDVLKNLLTDLSLTNHSPQAALSVTADGNLHVNIGQRWVSKPFTNGHIGLILPLETDYENFGCQHRYTFTNRRHAAAWWVSYPFKGELPSPLYTLWQQASEAELQRVKTASGYRKFHSALFWDCVMRDEARTEIFSEAFEKEEWV